MGINITLCEAKTQTKKRFPKLMIVTAEVTNKGMIVFFWENRCGIVIANPVSYKIGDIVRCWAMEHFSDHNEPVSITLQNA